MDIDLIQQCNLINRTLWNQLAVSVDATVWLQDQAQILERHFSITEDSSFCVENGRYNDLLKPHHCKLKT